MYHDKWLEWIKILYPECCVRNFCLLFVRVLSYPYQCCFSRILCNLRHLLLWCVHCFILSALFISTSLRLLRADWKLCCSCLEVIAQLVYTVTMWCIQDIIIQDMTFAIPLTWVYMKYWKYIKFVDSIISFRRVGPTLRVWLTMRLHCHTTPAYSLHQWTGDYKKTSPNVILTTIRAVCKCVLTTMSFSIPAVAVPLQSSRKFVYA